MKIVRTAMFGKSLKKLGASVADLESLEQEIANNPEAGDVIPGLGGARKIRFGMKGKGKRGGGRAIYLIAVRVDTVYLLLAYSKSEKGNLTMADKRTLAPLIEELKNG
jgi:hypothetical protein